MRVLALLGAVAGGAALWRRSRATQPELLELYFADGSSVAFGPGSPEGERLMPLARRILAGARG